MWKRKTAELEYDWDVADFEEEVGTQNCFYIFLKFIELLRFRVP